MTSLSCFEEPWCTAVALLLGLLIVWSCGLWWGSRHRGEESAVRGSKADDASLALLGLLLGFTFAMAIQKHDNRRQVMVADSNAIGDFYTVASMQREPVRTELLREIKTYAEFRLNLAKHWFSDEAVLNRAIDDVNGMQNRMTDTVHKALDSGALAEDVLVGTLNAVSGAHVARLAATRDRLPSSIVGLLFLASFVSVGVLGRHQGIEGKRTKVSTMFFILLISFTLYLTLDLNQPGKGLIHVSEEPLERLIATMGKSP